MVWQNQGYSVQDRVITQGGYSHTWEWQGGSVVMTPVLRIFNPIGSLFYTSTQSDGPPLSA